MSASAVALVTGIQNTRGEAEIKGIILSSALDKLHLGHVRHTDGDIQKAVEYEDVKLQRKFLAEDYLEIINLELAIVAKEMDEITHEECGQ